MDLRQLKYFVTLAEMLHFGRAAERLGMTQPPLSQAIQALEQELGVLLFHRTSRSVTLTAVGARWLPHARRLLEDAAALPDIARSLARGEIGALALSFISVADYSVLPTLLARYKQRWPRVDVTLREATSDVQIDALLAGEIDAGIIIPPPAATLPHALACATLLREPLVAAVPEEWLANGRLSIIDNNITLRAMLKEPLILFPRRSAPALHDIITGWFAEAGATPALGQEAIQMQTIIALVAAGMGVALVPQALRNLERRGVRYLALAGSAPLVETALVWRRADMSPTVQRLREIANALAGEKSRE